MKLLFLSGIVVLFGSFASVALADASDQPVKLAPYTVEERPFGFLGIKHATLALNPWKLVIGMNSIRFLQIDELDSGSPGLAAGVRSGDRVITIDNVPITKIGLTKLKRMGREVEVGQKIVIEVLRPSDGSRRFLTVTVAKKPKSASKSEPRADGHTRHALPPGRHLPSLGLPKSC